MIPSALAWTCSSGQLLNAEPDATRYRPLPQEEFQIKFWKLRQAEWQGYTVQLAPLTVKQGDLAAPAYFDFISAAQWAAVGAAMPGGRQLFEEYCEACGEGGGEGSRLVGRAPELQDNALLPGERGVARSGGPGRPACCERQGGLGPAAGIPWQRGCPPPGAVCCLECAAARNASPPCLGFCCPSAAFERRTGEVLYKGLREGFRGTTFAGVPAPPPPGAPTAAVLAGVEALVGAFVDQGFAIAASLRDVRPASAGETLAASAAAVAAAAWLSRCGWRVRQTGGRCARGPHGGAGWPTRTTRLRWGRS